MKTSGAEGPIKSPETRGLLIINTGEGKGKTTAALGLLFRAWGNDLKVVMLQFIKHKKANFGEHKAACRLGIEIISGGAGFVHPGVTKNLEENRKLARETWDLAKEKIESGNYDLVVLDELSYPLQFGWLTVDEVIETLNKRPKKLHVIITGRGIPQELIDLADTVNEIREIKHHFRQGIQAQPGIEF